MALPAIIGAGAGTMGVLVRVAARRAMQMFMSPVGQKVLPQAATGLGGGMAATQIISLGDVKNDVLQELSVANQFLNPSESDYVEAVSRGAAHLIEDIGSGKVLWATSRRTGEKIPPEYLIFNLQKGQAWITSRYYNKRSLSQAWRRGRAAGNSQGRRQLSQTVQTAK